MLTQINIKRRDFMITLGEHFIDEHTRRRVNEPKLPK